MSVAWHDLVEMCWNNVHDLDLTTPKWKFIFFENEEIHVNSILNKLLDKFGRYLKRIELADKCRIQTFVEKCPAVKIVVADMILIDVDRLNVLGNSYVHLTELALKGFQLDDVTLTKIFQANRKLANLKLWMFYDRNSLCFSKLNPIAVKRIHLYDCEWSCGYGFTSVRRASQ